MSEPVFQTYECYNPACRLRFPTDLSVSHLDQCPVCGSAMSPSGHPYSNFQREPHVNLLGETSLFIVLDNLRSAQNVGSIFRTANGCGVKHIFCCGTTPTPEHPRVRKSSLGAEQFTPWTYHPNSALLAGELKRNNGLLLAMESTPESTSLLDLPFNLVDHPKVILIFGNEISGIDPQLLSMTDEVVHIPMMGTKSSLNVAVSAGITLFLIVALIHPQPR